MTEVEAGLLVSANHNHSKIPRHRSAHAASGDIMSRSLVAKVEKEKTALRTGTPSPASCDRRRAVRDRQLRALQQHMQTVQAASRRQRDNDKPVITAGLPPRPTSAKLRASMASTPPSTRMLNKTRASIAVSSMRGTNTTRGCFSPTPTTTHHDSSTSSTHNQMSTSAHYRSSTLPRRSSNLTVAASPTHGGGKNQAMAFGEVMMVSRDDHDREKQRLTARIDELQNQLTKKENTIYELNGSKAELNKRIVELERLQKPLNENVRKLMDRNRTYKEDAKKTDETLRHLQETCNTLKDSHDRVLLENQRLKETRPNYEQKEEFDRIKAQNLEYCKLVTALKQQTVDKDRRLESVSQKLRRLRKGRGLTVDSGLDEPMSRSLFTPMAETSESSAMSLDTITEDEDALRPTATSSPLRRRVVHNNVNRSATTFEMPTSWKYNNDHGSPIPGSPTSPMPRDWALMLARLDAQQRRIVDLEISEKRLKHELEDTREHSELMEFQMLELQEMQAAAKEEASQSVSTQCTLLGHRSHSQSEDEGIYSQTSDLSSDEMAPTKMQIKELHTSKTTAGVEDLQKQLSALSTCVTLYSALLDKQTYMLTVSEHNTRVARERSKSWCMEAERLQNIVAEKDQLVASLEDVQRKYNDAKRQLDDSLQTIADYETMRRNNDVSLNAMQVEVSAVQQRCDVMRQDYEGMIAQEKQYNEKLEAQLHAHVQLADLLKNKLKSSVLPEQFCVLLEQCMSALSDRNIPQLQQLKTQTFANETVKQSWQRLIDTIISRLLVETSLNATSDGVQRPLHLECNGATHVVVESTESGVSSASTSSESPTHQSVSPTSGADEDSEPNKIQPPTRTKRSKARRSNQSNNSKLSISSTQGDVIL